MRQPELTSAVICIRILYTRPSDSYRCAKSNLSLIDSSADYRTNTTLTTYLGAPATAQVPEPRCEFDSEAAARDSTQTITVVAPDRTPFNSCDESRLRAVENFVLLLLAAA